MSEEVKMPLPGSLQEIVGSLLFASETPLTAAELREAIRAVDAEEGENQEVMEVYRTCTSKEIEAALRGLEKALDAAIRQLEEAGYIREVPQAADTWRVMPILPATFTLERACELLEALSKGDDR